MLRAFIEALEPEIREGIEEDSIADKLAAAVAEGRAAWPNIDVSDTRFAAEIAERIDGDDEVLVQLERLRPGDFYLAVACADGDDAAVAAFETEYGADIRRAVASVGRTAVGGDDLAQRLREKLFVSDGERPPRITAYSGRGSLRAWVRVTGVRAVLDAVRWDPGRRKVAMESGMLEAIPDAEPDLELDYLRRAHAERIPEAMRTAFDSLSARQRNLLRQRFLHGLSTGAIAKMYGVHRATAFRWLETARANLFERTRTAITDKLDVSGRELESLLAALRSRLDISVGGMLEADLEQD